MLNVLIVKNADFSQQSVEVVPLVDPVFFQPADYQYKDRKLQCNNNDTPEGTFQIVQSNSYYGGFLNVAQYAGKDFILKNNGPERLFYIPIGAMDFSTAIPTFTQCVGVSEVQQLNSGLEVNGTLPNDAQWMYILTHFGTAGDVDSKVTILIPRD